MQNKGLVRILGIALALVCLFYLSFNLVTGIYENKAEERSLSAKQELQKSPVFAALTAKEKSDRQYKVIY